MHAILKEWRPVLISHSKPLFCSPSQEEINKNKLKVVPWSFENYSDQKATFLCKRLCRRFVVQANLRGKTVAEYWPSSSENWPDAFVFVYQIVINEVFAVGPESQFLSPRFVVTINEMKIEMSEMERSDIQQLDGTSVTDCRRLFPKWRLNLRPKWRPNATLRAALFCLLYVIASKCSLFTKKNRRLKSLKALDIGTYGAWSAAPRTRLCWLWRRRPFWKHFKDCFSRLALNAFNSLMLLCEKYIEPTCDYLREAVSSDFKWNHLALFGL